MDLTGTSSTNSRTDLAKPCGFQSGWLGSPQDYEEFTMEGASVYH